MRRRNPVGQEVLQQRLDALVETFDVSTIEPDPLQLVLRFDDPLDQEVAGLIAAAFAYGRADIIVSNIGRVLSAMAPSPYRYLAVFDRADAERRFASFAHRFHKMPQLVELFERMGWALRTHGSLGELFRTCYRAADADIGPTLARFVSALRSGGSSKSLAYLLTSPEDGSACKRMNL